MFYLDVSDAALPLLLSHVPSVYFGSVSFSLLLSLSPCDFRSQHVA
jgi:hypothetical protein